MTEAKFTPGPWWPGHMADPTTKCECRNIISETCMGSVARIPEPGGDGDNPPEHEAVANAHLIAAAPDLYEALETLLDDCSMSASEGAQSVARAALAKARGEVVDEMAMSD